MKIFASLLLAVAPAFAQITVVATTTCAVPSVCPVPATVAGDTLILAFASHPGQNTAAAITVTDGANVWEEAVAADGTNVAARAVNTTAGLVSDIWWAQSVKGAVTGVTIGGPLSGTAVIYELRGLNTWDRVTSLSNASASVPFTGIPVRGTFTSKLINATALSAPVTQTDPAWHMAAPGIGIYSQDAGNYVDQPAFTPSGTVQYASSAIGVFNNQFESISIAPTVIPVGGTATVTVKFRWPIGPPPTEMRGQCNASLFEPRWTSTPTNLPRNNQFDAPAGVTSYSFTVTAGTTPGLTHIQCNTAGSVQTSNTVTIQ